MNNTGTKELESRVTVVLKGEDVTILENWRRKQKEIPSKADAIRSLMKSGLEAEDKAHA